MSAATYADYGRRTAERTRLLLNYAGVAELPRRYADFMQLDQWTRKFVGRHLPLVLSDNYEHFMAVLPHRTFAAQHVLIRKQIGGFTTVAGFWKWLEFLSHKITEAEVELAADFFSGAHNNHRRQFDREYWLHVVRDYGGYLPLRIEYVGEGATFTGVPFPVAQIYGETPAVWLNEPMYIQIGHLAHIATVAAQFAEVIGDPWRFIEVMFRALHNADEADDVLLAMLVGGGIISTSNDFGAFVNGSPFKCAGTTGHCWYQQFFTNKAALRTLLRNPLGPYATVLLDTCDHAQGFRELIELIEEEGCPPPFAVRPDSGDAVALGMGNLTTLQDAGHQVNVVIEDGKRPRDILAAEKLRRQMGLKPERLIYGAGGALLGSRSALEAAYKACYFHDGTPAAPENQLNTMKICLDDPMKASLPGLVQCFRNPQTGVYTIGTRDEAPPQGTEPAYQVLYDGLTNPGEPFFDPAYNPDGLATSAAVTEGVERSRSTRALLGPSFTLDVEPNRFAIGLTQALRKKRVEEIRRRAPQNARG